MWRCTVQQLDERQYFDDSEVLGQDKQLREQAAVRFPEGTGGRSGRFPPKSDQSNRGSQTAGLAEIQHSHSKHYLYSHRPAEKEKNRRTGF